MLNFFNICLLNNAVKSTNFQPNNDLLTKSKFIIFTLRIGQKISVEMVVVELVFVEVVVVEVAVVGLGLGALIPSH